MRSYIRIALMMFLVLGSVACSPATAATQPVPVPTKAYHPLSARTGLEAVDPVLEALASGDAQAVRSLIQFTNAPCTRQDGLGGPPKCREAEAEGTPVEVLPFLGPEGSFLRKEEIADWQGVDAAGVFAIYKVSAAVTFEQYYPAGEYGLMLVGKDDRSFVNLRLSEGRIVRVDSLLGDFPKTWQETLQREAATLILPPLHP